MKPFIFPEAVLAQHSAFLGKTGSGKTSTAKLAVEQIVRDDPTARVCILDPLKSDWWGLTSSSDGKRPGLPFQILGGPHGHVNLHDTSGKVIGELVASGALPLSIIDMKEFEPGGLQRFFNAFAPALMKKMRGVVTLVIEEAHEFAPKERSGIGAETTAIHYAKQLATAGRSLGIRLMVLTQRTQSLHNALLGSCDTMVAHRFTAPADQEPILKWLKANFSKEVFEKVAASMASLKTGSAWVCSGEARLSELVQFQKISTYDNSRTPTNSDSVREVKTAPVDREKLAAIIGEAVAKADADDPEKLRKQLADAIRDRDEFKHGLTVASENEAALATALQKEQASTFDAEELDKARKAAFDEGVGEVKREAAAAITTLLRAFHDQLSNLTQSHGNLISSVGTSIEKVSPISNPSPSASPAVSFTAAAPKTPARPIARPERASKAPAREGGSSSLTGPQSRIVDALQFWRSPHGIGSTAPTRKMVAAIAEYSAKSGGFRNVLSELHTAGIVEYPSTGEVKLTAIGASLGVPFTRQEARNRLIAAMRAPAYGLAEALLVNHPRSTGREELAVATDRQASSGGYRNLLSELHTMDVTRHPERGTVILTEWAYRLLR